MQRIKVIIDTEGNVKLEVNGIKGASCKDVTKALEKALGSVTDRKLTSEYHQREVSNVSKSSR